MANDDSKIHIPANAENTVWGKINQSEPINFQLKRIKSFINYSLPGATNPNDNQLIK
jgi:hypothetical protein